MKFPTAHVKTILAIVGGFALVAWGCSIALRNGPFPWEWEEISRVASPSGGKEILIMRGNRGAMSGYRFAYYVIPRGAKAPVASGWPKDATFICTAPTPGVRWTDDRRVLLQVKTGILILAYVPHLDALGVSVDVADITATTSTAKGS